MTDHNWILPSADPPVEEPVLSLEPEFPAWFDSSSLATANTCPQRWFYESCLRLVPKSTNIHLNAGGAYAKGLETFRKLFYTGHDFDTAREAGLTALIKAYGPFNPGGPRDYKTWDRTCAAYLSYLNEWDPRDDHIEPLSLPDGRPAIEVSFAVPLLDLNGDPILHPETHDPLLFTGRSDMLCSFGNELWCFDDKTVGSFSGRWAEDQRLRGQFSGYTWAFRQMGYSLVGSWVRGTAIQKEQIKHNQTRTYRPQWKLDRWHHTAVMTVQRMLSMWHNGHFLATYNDACTQYGGCKFFMLCDSETPAPFVPVYFKKSTWNPVGEEV